MKKFPILITITVLFCSLTVGMFIGQNLRREPILVSVPDRMLEIPPETETSEKSPFPINLNTATREELETLPGIGEVLALRIWSYRTTHGKIESLEELQQIDGIGKETIKKIQGLVYLGGTK